MPLMISTVFLWLVRRIPVLALAGVVTLTAGEVLMRTGIVLPVIDYDKSDPMMPWAKPDQRCVMYVAQATYRCPPIEINSEGMRGPTVDWSKKVIAVLGSSQVMGTGVAEDEVGVQVLDRMLQQKFPEYTVANCGLGGFGPYHQARYLEKLAAEHKLHAAVVRLANEDCIFLPSATKQRHPVVNWLRDNSRLFSTLSRKASAQLGLLRKAFRAELQKVVKLRLSRQPTATAEQSYTKELAQYRLLGPLPGGPQKDHLMTLINTAGRFNLPLMFVVPDPLGTECEKFHVEVLAALARQRQNGNVPVFVEVITPEDYGLAQYTMKTRLQEFNKQFTLRCDPHSNAAAHQLFAEKTFELLQRSGLVR